MNADPTILLLDDERLQLMTMRSQLRGMGRLVEFTGCQAALDFARANPIDAAVVDIRMPGQPMDGLAFLRQLRSFDADVSVIIRTADQSDRIADGAIETRALRRFIKSRTTLEEFHRFALAAIAETRARRHQAAAARESDESRRQLHEALGTYDVTITAASVCKGVIQSMRNDLTALDILAHEMGAQPQDTARLPGLAAQNQEVVSRMIAEIDTFLDGPFNASSNATTASVNDTLLALRAHFAGATEWLSVGKTASIGLLEENVFVSCPPMPLLNALKHLAEFCLSRMADGAALAITPVPAESGKTALNQQDSPHTVLNRSALRTDRPCVVFRFRAEMPPCSAAESKDILEPPISAARTANMGIVQQALAVSGGSLVLLGGRNESLRIDVILMVAIE